MTFRLPFLLLFVIVAGCGGSGAPPLFPSAGVRLTEAQACAVGYDLAREIHTRISLKRTVLVAPRRAAACERHALEYLRRAGFRIDRHAQADNLVYVVHAGNGLPPIRAYSKTFQDPANPGDGFCAVMTCSSADRDCPVITGADKRVLLPYEDPGSSDGTGLETDVYDDRCREICREMIWLFARIGAE